MLRAGGYVNRDDGKGWVLASDSEQGAVDTSVETAAAQEAIEDEAPDKDISVEGQTVRDRCPDCGKEVAVNKDGSLRKHTCQIEADPPDVTFDDSEDSY